MYLFSKENFLINDLAMSLNSGIQTDLSLPEMGGHEGKNSAMKKMYGRGMGTKHLAETLQRSSKIQKTGFR